ncbi:hypothetical protein ROZALSC1DRAFT_29555 [Rozella allomycis CSF55]|uniref:Uncharacterized protein n=1 Tax=Rozella allomycis (strain CSF55) TaxID=988480 RepID=A0A075AVB2_ROZAC|nr:hypothetical protein O9G_004070 [Rozella allomycis CSF55]RKP18795.1 hypothetical protein ROZALSC1DRAFT_29555 [Rozella allomycis CSF55]|eukprot:EPZ34193.1 hypothetical protein O9G_004070 [Rozella allomycis CSF55]
MNLIKNLADIVEADKNEPGSENNPFTVGFTFYILVDNLDQAYRLMIGSIVLSDASDAISNAFQELLPIESYVYEMCCAHVELSGKVNGVEKLAEYVEDTRGKHETFTSNWQAYLTPPKCPVTNNRIASFNAHVNCQYTPPERLAAGERFGIFADIIDALKITDQGNLKFGAALAQKAMENK